MDKVDNGDMKFQQIHGSSLLNCPSSGMNSNPLSDQATEIAMNSGSAYKLLNATDPYLNSGWDPLISLSQGENFVGSSTVPHSTFASLPYSGMLENHSISSSSHLVHYHPSDSGLVDMMPKLHGFGSGHFSEMLNSFGLPDCAQISSVGCPPNYSQNKEGANEKTSIIGSRALERQISEGGSAGTSPEGKRKRKAPEPHSFIDPSKNFDGEKQKDNSEHSSENHKGQDEKKRKGDQNIGTSMCGKQSGKQVKNASNDAEAPNDTYIHVRAKRGQATNSHSLAERVRRERISERMRLLQDLVPGCSKITGKAVMLDEIINYVQSLQQQVEFLSMKLATVNPELNINIDRLLSKDILHSTGNSPSGLGFGQALNSFPYHPGIPPAGISSKPLPFHPMPQATWNNELQSLLNMGFDLNPTMRNQGTSNSFPNSIQDKCKQI